MAPLDIVILSLVAAAFIAVCVRVRRKGACADCAHACACAKGHRPAKRRSCPALRGAADIADELSRHVR
ncbi:hypothetical protein Corgl_1456 [Coriobacterium glomerans PW2]|uniref:FeoB-associated Cys-rich membrane protein n=1 Tax=Coriobacterium glomerans (strain ATCC 49209 / DSM 20642 / JCM 10262 / PW2) TaxID=700015 RepID=F2N8V6_CORGP|nr:hypothetical protein [Coriobacterium glomerans]AEB07556.1 hypothetical protein Corgl_1456 [Coriobacterium glomerans PW2]